MEITGSSHSNNTGNNIIYEMFIDYPDVINIDDLTHMLGIGKNKAYELVNNGKIQSIKIGRKHIIPKFRVIEFLQNVK